ncbi:O-antigen ligase family protein [Bradyrhizobium quebecense]|uniref:O-antigen ligase family protein n=1 Tax=Bradyrhizobium quebecense TaxID=2748629 RepID=A0A973WRJ0_9BRAD|nr:O-antigen ligase family protein [Bradyrhizobium quebecense]UGA46672.1 O-antigen ligase family protein [Bradyrhizobium quebecense]
MSRLNWIFLALFLGQLPILVLAHGFGAGSGVSAVYMIGALALLLMSGNWRGLTLLPADLAFLVFAAAIGCSTWGNGLTAPLKEYVLLGLSLGAYVAGRTFPLETPDRWFRAPLLLVLVVGSILVANALIVQWNDRHGKPLLFDKFDAAPVQFMTCAAFLLFAAINGRLSRAEAVIILGLCSISLMIFAASQVRFAFVAMTVAIVLGRSSKISRPVMFCGAVLLAFAILGLVVRWHTTLAYLQQLVGAAGCDGDSSIGIRKQLYVDAFGLLPSSGWFGRGLDAFMSHSCVQATEVHNSILQAVIEFGWVGGAAFAVLIFGSLAVRSPFVLTGLLFELAISMAYGRISRDGALLFFVGYAVQFASRPATAPVADAEYRAVQTAQ